MRKKIRKAFKDAKEHLWDGTRPMPAGKNIYICHCFDTSQSGREARKIIMARIYPAYTLDEWLEDRVSSWFVAQPYLQQHRHAWLDMLIKEFS